MGDLYPDQVPIGNGLSGTTGDDFSWLAMNCDAATGADQLLIRLDAGGTEQAVQVLYDFAAAIAKRQRCRLPYVTRAFRLPATPRPQPVSGTEQLCGLLPASPIGPPAGWLTLRTPAPRDVVDYCTVFYPPHGDMTDVQLVGTTIITLRGPFAGRHANQLDFYSYPQVCRGPGVIYALKQGLTGVIEAFTAAMLARPKVYCNER